MNKFSLIGLLLLCNSLFLIGQVDKKYLAGAVPLVDNKVTFTREVRVNESLSQNQLLGLIKDWMDKEYNVKPESHQRVLLVDELQNYVVAQGDEKLVFKAQVFMLDQANFTYQLIVRAEKGKATMEFRNIKYGYQDYKEAMPAEQMIADEVALHKSGEKLNRHYDKFRMFTIDRVDDLRASLVASLSQVSVADIKSTPVAVIATPPSIVDVVEELPQPAPVVKVENSPAVSVAQPMLPLQPATRASGMEGYTLMKADEISESIMNMFKDSWAVVVAGKGADKKPMVAAWSGTGNFGGNPVAMTIVANETSDETYTISFYTPIHKSKMDEVEKGNDSKLTPIHTPSGAKAYAEAWMVIECKKVLEQEVTESMVKGAQSKEWNKNNYKKLFMGEILNVWAR